MPWWQWLILIGETLLVAVVAIVAVRKLIPLDRTPPRPDSGGHVEVFRPIDIPLPPKEEFHEVPGEDFLVPRKEEDDEDGNSVR